MKTIFFKRRFLISFFLIFLINYSGTFSQNVGDSAYINVNKIYLPFNKKDLEDYYDFNRRTANASA